MNDQTIEQQIQSSGANVAPRVTPADIEAEIRDEVYFTAAQGSDAEESNDPVLASYDSLGLLTFCVLVLRNGTKIVGINYGAIDPAQHSAEQGRRSAREHAIEQIWPLLGFRLRDRLAEPPGRRPKVLSEADALADLQGTPRPFTGCTCGPNEACRECNQ